MRDSAGLPNAQRLLMSAQTWSNPLVPSLSNLFIQELTAVVSIILMAEEFSGANSSQHRGWTVERVSWSLDLEKSREWSTNINV